MPMPRSATIMSSRSNVSPRKCVVCGEEFIPKRKSTARICPTSKCRMRKLRETKRVLTELGDYYDRKAANK